MPKSPFGSVARVAIEEMIREHGSASKFGLFYTEDSIESLVEDISRFLETSRNLRAAGDKFMNKAPPQKGDIRRTVR